MAKKLNSKKSFGVSAAAEILKHLKPGKQDKILDALSEMDSNLSSMVRDSIFKFEDLVRIDDAGFSKWSNQSSPENWAAALKLTAQVVKDKVQKNTSASRWTEIEDAMSIPVRFNEAEKAQMALLALATKLEEHGEIVIKNSDEVYV